MALDAAKPKTCAVCFDQKQLMRARTCCQLLTCRACLTTYVEAKVREGVVFIQCPGPHCSRRLQESEISSSLVNNDAKQMFRKCLVDAQNDPTCKTCPRCGLELRVQEDDLKSKETLMGGSCGYPVTCVACALEWCFPCHAPWHKGVTCQQYVTNRDKHFKSWVRKRDGPNEQINAQRCPHCQTYIQRSAGCNSMTCSRCATCFCYQCGVSTASTLGISRPWLRFFFGDHGRRWTPLGCPSLLWPTSPLRRWVVKGFIFGAKVLGTVILPFLLLFLAVVALAVVLVVALPFFTYRYVKMRDHRPTVTDRKKRQLPPPPLGKQFSRRCCRVGAVAFLAYAASMFAFGTWGFVELLI